MHSPTTTKGISLDNIRSIDKFRVPIGNQEIELQQISYAAGGMPLLRVRIREGSRFTVFEIDSQTAQHWGQAMLGWAQSGIPAVLSGDAAE